MACEYSWKPGSRFSVNAQVAGEAIEAIRRANGNGPLPPAAVVDAARDPEHPLHPAFNWDDSAAAEAWRTQQARVLIYSIRVVHRKEYDPTPRVAFVSVREAQEVDEEGNPQPARIGYMDSKTAMQTPTIRDQVLADAERSLLGFRERFRGLEELESLFNQIDEWLKSRKKKSAK